MQKCYDVRFARKKDFPFLKELWKSTFGDEDAVIDNFFDKTVFEKNAVAVFDGEKAVSALYALECNCKAGSDFYKALYIYGVSTLTEYRNKGLMRRAMEFVEKEARKNSCDILFLVPAEKKLFEMYEKFGFKTAVYCKESEVSRFICNEEYKKEEISFSAYTEYRNNCKFPLFSLNERAFDSFFNPVGDSIKCFYIKNKGYCLYEIENGEVVVHELFGDKDALLSLVFKSEKMDFLKLREFTENKDVPYGMIKLLNEKSVADNFFFGVCYGG